jgi:hypothetical protein
MAEERPVRIEPRWNMMDGVVPFGGRFAFPRRWQVKIDDPNLPYRVELEIVAEGGSFACRGLRCESRPGGPAVTGEGIRRLPIAGFVRHTLQDVALVQVGKGHYVPLGDQADLEEIFAAYRRTETGRRPITDDELAEVAEIYRAALLSDPAPTRAVAKAKHLSRSHAARLVGRARAAGFLGPTRPGKAGEEMEPTPEEPGPPRRRSRKES